LVEHRSPKPRAGGSSPSTPATVRASVPASGTKQEGREVKPRTSPMVFLQQVRQEVAKVTWPSRRETLITTLMVFAMVLVSALFFFVVDQVINFAVGYILKIGS
jgi:preprotein translocase subunit SecE